MLIYTLTDFRCNNCGNNTCYPIGGTTRIFEVNRLNCKCLGCDDIILVDNNNPYCKTSKITIKVLKFLKCLYS